MAVPPGHHHHHRRRSPIRPYGLRPCFRRFKLRPSYLPRREFYSPIRSREQPAMPRAGMESWDGLGARQEADLESPRNEPSMQATPRYLKAPPGSGALKGRRIASAAFSPLPEVSPAKRLGTHAERNYPGLYRPGFKDPPDLRDRIHMKPKPPVHRPLPPLAPPPLPLSPCYRASQIRPYGPASSTPVQHLPLWADPDRWASARSGPGLFPGSLHSPVRMGPTEGPTSVPVRSSAHLACMPEFAMLERRVWTPGDSGSMDQCMYADRHHLPPRFAPRIVAGPWRNEPGPLFERGRTPRDPASQMTRAARLEEMERLGIRCLGQE